MVNPINWDTHSMKEPKRIAERFSERESFHYTGTGDSETTITVNT